MSDLQSIPGVGPAVETALMSLGLGCVDQLADRDPEQLYRQLCSDRGETVDRCVLYVFRCAVYFAREEQHDAELLKWWNWKSRAYVPSETSRSRPSAGKRTAVHPGIFETQAADQSDGRQT